MDNVVHSRQAYHPLAMASTVHRALTLMWPRHWVKNGFVLLGVVFGNAWLQPQRARKALVTAGAFSLISSSAYILNDLFDRKNALYHLRKKLRPLAAGQISVAAWLISVPTR